MVKRALIHPRKKQKILERDNFTCINCGATGDFNCLEVDHIIPVINGGNNEESNLQTLCYKCNMKKRFGKDTTKKYFLDMSPINRLELVKERLKQYKDLTYPEFKVVFTQDELFKRLRLDLLYLNDLFFEISGNKKGETESKGKYIGQRNALIKIIRDKLGITYQDIEKLLKNKGISMSYQQIAKICLEKNENFSNFG